VVAEGERRKPGQVERLPRSPSNARYEPRLPRPFQQTHQPLDDAKEQAGEEQREQAERQLQQETEHEPWLERGMERKRLRME
jgi:hypothetical protein